MEEPGASESHRGDADEEGTKSMRPTTARRRPPKVKETTREMETKDAAPVAVKKAEGILMDGEIDEDEDILGGGGQELNPRLAEAKDLGGDAAETTGQSKIVQDIKNRQAEKEALARGATTTTAEPVEEPLDTTSDQKNGGGIRLKNIKKTGTRTASLSLAV